MASIKNFFGMLYFKFKIIIEGLRMLNNINDANLIRKFFQQVDNVLNNIENIDDNIVCKIDLLNINNIPAKIDLESDILSITIPIDKYQIANDFLGKNIVVIVNDRYIFEEAFINNIKHVPNNIENTTLNIVLNGFHVGESKTSNMCVLKLPNKIHQLSNIFESASQYAEISIHNHNFHMAILHNRLFIYSENSFDEKEFLKIINAIKLALGFLSCCFIGGKELYLSINGTFPNFSNISYLKYYNMAEERVFDFDILPQALTAIKLYFEHNKLGEIWCLTQEQFQNLCELIYKEEHIQTAIYYLADSAINGIQLSNKLVLLACSFEAITRYVRNNSNEKIVKDQELFNALKDDIKSSVMDFLDDHTNYDFDYKNDITSQIDKKIQNQISNADKYKLPFSTYNIPLWSKEEKNIIEKRNNMFHGEPFKYDDDLNTDILKYQKQTRIYYYYIYVIILKIIGYSGWIINIRLWNEIVSYHNNFFENMQKGSPNYKEYNNDNKKYVSDMNNYEKQATLANFMDDYMIYLS